MEDLSLHILDVVENSIDAGATKIEIEICEDLEEDALKIEITDNGKGMNEIMREEVLNPFFTTKKVRRVGLGLSLFKEAAKMANGDLVIKSERGFGTRVSAFFQHSHIDRKPFGDMTKTIKALIIGHPEIRIKYLHGKNGMKQTLDTEKLEAEGDLSTMSTLEIINVLKKNLKC